MKTYFGVNHHANVTKGSQKFANHLINYLYNKLLAKQTDADIATIVVFYVVFVQDWNKGYVKWHDAFNFEMSTTIEMNAMSEMLTKVKAPLWVGKIWGVYPQGTSRATALIPHGRQALITGTATEKISGMETLLAQIGTDPDLAALKTDVQNFLDIFRAASEHHSKAIIDLKELSRDQEHLRIKTTASMLHCQGSLILKYWEMPEKIDLFFDVSAMRNRQGEVAPNVPYLVSLHPSEIKLINLDYTFKDIWEVSNDGEKDACMFFGKTSTIVEIPDDRIVIPAGDSVQIDLSILDPEQRFAYAANLSSEDDGELLFVLLPTA
jgi:hypothetical protein